METISSWCRSDEGREISSEVGGQWLSFAWQLTRILWCIEKPWSSKLPESLNILFIKSLIFILIMGKSNHLNWTACRLWSCPSKVSANEDIQQRGMCLAYSECFEAVFKLSWFRWSPCGTARLTSCLGQRSIPPLSTCGESAAFSTRWLLADHSSLDPRW